MLEKRAVFGQKMSGLMLSGLALLLGVFVYAFASPTVSAQSADNYCAAGQQPKFRFGFAALKGQRGDIIGDPVECEHYDDEGNAYQKTTTGELFYNKSTGRTTFTANNSTSNAQSSDNFCAVGEQPQFRFGFAALKRQMGNAVGDPLECEHYDKQGNAYQKTTTGELYYNKSTGQSTFTPNSSTSAPATPTSGSGSASSTANCRLPATASNAEGPYYTPNAPFRNVLVEPGMAGTRLLLTGQVLSTDCQPVAGALLDFWQADAYGDYDNVGYTLRGRQYADSQGYYRLETIVPEFYTGRTRHIHVKVSRPGGAILTTQIYFQGERGNQSDSLYDPSLQTSLVTRANGAQRGTFDFVFR